MDQLVRSELSATSLVVAIDCGKVANRVMLASGEHGVIGEPASLSTLSGGVEKLEHWIAEHVNGKPPVIAVEATGALHQAWVRELERRFEGSVRLFAPSETQAARAGLGSRRFKTDDRDCAALVSLARQGLGRRPDDESVEALLAAVRHRRALVGMRKVAQQRLHDQLNALCPGLSAPAGHGRALKLEDPSGQAVLACAVEFRGRPPAPRSLIARAPGRLTPRNASYWADRWRQCLAAAARCRTSRRAPRLGSRALAAPATGHRSLRGADCRAAAEHPRPGTHKPPRCWSGARRCLCRPLAADRALRDSRAPVFGNWPGPSCLSVGNAHEARAHLPPGPLRAPRRVDGDRLGSLPVLALISPARARAQGPGHAADRGARRARPPRVSPLLRAVGQPTSLRRGALRSGQAWRER
jgi:Transposase